MTQIMFRNLAKHQMLSDARHLQHAGKNNDKIKHNPDASQSDCCSATT